MRRPMIGAVALAALAVGGAVVVATSRHSSNTQAYQAPATLESASTVPADTRPVVAPVTETAPPKVVVRERVVYRAAPARRVVVKKRSTRKSVAIIGGSTVGGAVVGGLIGGKKGAVIGGVAGGTAGTVYDRKTRKKKRVVQ